MHSKADITTVSPVRTSSSTRSAEKIRTKFPLSVSRSTSSCAYERVRTFEAKKKIRHALWYTPYHSWDRVISSGTT
ncbi:hypothetical protein Y032_0273g984 [Ancylostoma ceylanicum]|uniref:Uncharacterized protein n=1 Tax=Ancylostoma ceylanicum TaxID=53326 RepID=A0A016S7Y4_9BILA|nr:hypothetical protein Y032_0273g984 [Ancylostoma ceylanicum]